MIERPPKPPKPLDRPPSPRFKTRSKSSQRQAPSFEVTKTRPTTEESEAAWKEIREASPRAAAILAVTYVQSAIRFAIQARFVPLSDDELKSLEKPGAPLSSFSQAIDLGFALGLFGPMIHHDLTIVRVIRNAFAHTMKPLSFDTPDFAKEIANLQYLKTIKGHVTRSSEGESKITLTRNVTRPNEGEVEMTLGQLMDRGLIFATNREKYVETCMMIAADVAMRIDFKLRPGTPNLP